MTDKYLLIMDDIDESELETLEQKLIDFAVNKFGEDIVGKIEAEVEHCLWDDTLILSIELNFNEYKYVNKVHGELRQSYSLILEDKGYQPFYNDGKYFKKYVFDFMMASGFQNGVTEVYGFNADDVSNEFEDYILTC